MQPRRSLITGGVARPWAAVHSTGLAALILGAATAASLLLAHSDIRGIGPIRFLAPVSSLLLMPAVTGTAAALACFNGALLPLPDPARAKLARFAWALVWTVAAVLASNAGQLSGSDASWEAVARNVVLNTALALVIVTAGFPTVAWLPPIVLSMVTIMFGTAESQSHYVWWSVLLRNDARGAELLVIVTAGLAVAAGYALFGARRRGRY